MPPRSDWKITVCGVVRGPRWRIFDRLREKGGGDFVKGLCLVVFFLSAVFDIKEHVFLSGT